MGMPGANPHRTGGEERNADHEVSFAAQCARQPPDNGQNDRIGQQIRCQHPRCLILACPQIPRNMRKRNICDAGIQHLHEGRKRHGDGDQPGIERWLPLLIRSIAGHNVLFGHYL
jgi:hypothetical protein